MEGNQGSGSTDDTRMRETIPTDLPFTPHGIVTTREGLLDRSEEACLAQHFQAEDL